MTTDVCPEWLEPLSAYFDNALDVVGEQRLHAHVRHCPACGELFMRWVPMLQTLRHTPAPGRPARDCWAEISFVLRREGYGEARLLSWRRLSRPAIGWIAAAVVVTSGTLAVVATNGHSEPVADLDLYYHQHDLYTHEQGMPSLYAPEYSAVKASYQLDE